MRVTRCDQEDLMFAIRAAMSAGAVFIMNTLPPAAAQETKVRLTIVNPVSTIRRRMATATPSLRPAAGALS
jgi:hypothetical protein